MGALGKRAAKIAELPRLADGYQLDAAAASAQIRAEKPQLIVLGRSLFLFPEDIAGIREACDEVGTTVLYDGSHVLGLISGGQFQDPLGEGADLMTASTHKTYYGPQRGIVVARGKDKDWWKPIDRAVFPGVTSNHHLFSLPAMYAASLEVQEFGAWGTRRATRSASTCPPTAGAATSPASCPSTASSRTRTSCRATRATAWSTPAASAPASRR